MICVMRIFLINLVIGLIPISTTVFAQQTVRDVAGKYSDGFGEMVVTELDLRVDGTFTLVTTDPIFSYSFKSFSNIGTWGLDSAGVILNPDKVPRQIQFRIAESSQANDDSIIIQIDYHLLYFRNEEFKGEANFDFDQLTIFVNDKRKYYNLVRHKVRSICAFSPTPKSQIIVDSLNRVRIPKMEIKRLGIMTYGFGTPIWQDIMHTHATQFEISISHPVDEERTPRSKRVIIKRNRAYFYEVEGKVDKSLLPLTRQSPIK